MPRSPVTSLLAGLLVAIPALVADAQVRRGGGGGDAAAGAPPRAQPLPASRPAAGANRPVRSTDIQGGARTNTGRTNTAQGGNRTVANANVNIGNDINVVRPPSGGGQLPPYRPQAGAVYRPPVVVPVYPGYNTPTAGAVLATGIVAGATAGLVAGAMQQPSTTVVQAPAPTGGTTLHVGTQLAALPAGCSVQTVGQATYHRCGTAWVQGFMQGSQVIYVVVPAP